MFRKEIARTGWAGAMRDVIQELRSEHANMERILKVLDRQIGVFEAAGQPDYTTIEDIVLYFLDYPDQCHHPKEDLVAQRLLELAPDRAAPLRVLADQHKELGALTHRMAGVIRRVLEEAELPRREVIAAVKAFVDAQRHHIQMEEAHFLPLAEELLSASDLQALASELFGKTDPLFGSKTERHFEMLRNYILKSEAGDREA